MDKSVNIVDFNRMVREIEEEQILLPDFQRKFKWTGKEIQEKLVASVLCRMPIGSVLLLDLPANEYAARRIGRGNKDKLLVLNTEDIRQFLLDGQQRITVMVNAFSNLLHEDKGTTLDSLKRRYFLGIPTPENKEKYDEDYWGLNKLSFPFDTPKTDIPEFSTEEIREMIFSEDFTKNTEKAFHPNVPEEPDKLKKLFAYCMSEPGYYKIPLYLIVQRANKSTRSINKNCLMHILNGIAESQKMYLKQKIEALDTMEQQKECLAELLENTLKAEEVYKDADTSEEKLKNVLNELAETWAEDMQEYLYCCMERMDLHIMGVPNSSRKKAIEIFENMNSGGIKLSAFDLVMARASRENSNFMKDLEKECERSREYPAVKVSGDVLQSYCEKYIAMKRNQDGRYNALYDTECVDKKGEYSKQFQDAFLNVLALACARSKGEEPKYGEVMGREHILRLGQEEINAHYKECCEALDRAAFFLKARCGIRKITEANYQLMVTVIAYLFLDDKNYESSKVWNLLNAWYWCAIFAGRYDKDQNTQVVRDLEHLSRIIEEKKDSGGYIEGLHKDAWKVSNFSEESFLLYEKSKETGNYPKEILGKYICQFYLAEGYYDMITAKNGNGIFLCTFPVDEEAVDLEIHHVIPQNSFQSIREFEKKISTERDNVARSPLNVAYISKHTNRKISNCNYASYVKYLETGTVPALGFPTDVPGQQLESLKIEEILRIRLGHIQDRLSTKRKGWMVEWEGILMNE